MFSHKELSAILLSLNEFVAKYRCEGYEYYQQETEFANEVRLKVKKLMEEATIFICRNRECGWEGHEDEYGGKCPKCLSDIEEVCEMCLGEGEVTTMERVYAGEPHVAPIGTRKCICQMRKEVED